jgi:hypothetical protein
LPRQRQAVASHRVDEDKRGNFVIGIECEDGGAAVPKPLWLVGRDRDDPRIGRMQYGFAECRPVDLELGQGRTFVAFDKHEIARRESIERLVHRQLRRPPEFVHQCPADAGGDQNLGTAGMTMTEAVLSGMVDLERVVRVLDQRYPQAFEDQARNQLLDQGRLAAAGPAGEAE